MSEYLGREFHRRSTLDAGRTEAEQKLKEETKGQTLGEWFNKEKRKPAPQVEDVYSDETFTCARCGKQENNLNRFPGGICFSCYEKKEGQEPLTEQGFNQMTNTFKNPLRKKH